MAWYTNTLSIYKKKTDTGRRYCDHKKRIQIGIWHIAIVSNVKTKSSFIVVSGTIGKNDGEVKAVFDEFSEATSFIESKLLPPIKIFY